MSLKRGAGAVIDEGEEELVSLPKRQNVDLPSSSILESKDTNKNSGERMTLVDKLKFNIESSLKKLMELNGGDESIKVWSKTLSTLNNVNAGQDASEQSVADSEWGQYKMEKIHQVALDISHKIEDMRRKSCDPHVHQHTSKDCQVCGGCLLHIEESVTRRLIPYLDDNFSNQRNLFPRRQFDNRAAFFTRGRGGKQVGQDQRRSMGPSN